MSDQTSRRQFIISSSGLIVAAGCGKEETGGGPEQTEPIGDPDYYPNTSRMPSMPTDNPMASCGSTPGGNLAGPLASSLSVNQSVLVSGNVWVSRDDKGVFGLNIVCQHAGCVYSSMKIDPSSQDWICMCHGSRYGFDGSLKNGPATRPLTKYYACRGSDGRIYVDTTKII